MLKDMEYVYAVYQEKSFSKAAKKLFISQPALSTTIKKVETKIQVSIFDRSSNPIQVTTAGKYYIKSIEKIMAIQKEMETYFSTISKEKNGTINIGSSAFFCAHILPSIVGEFKEKYPSYNVNILETNVEETINCMDSGAIHLSIGVESLDAKTFNSKIWRDEHIILAVPASFKINQKLEKYCLTFEDIKSKKYLESKCPAINMKYFKDELFLLLRKGNDLYRRGMKMCHNAGFKPKVTMYLDQLLTSYYVAYSGNGIAFVRGDMTLYVEATEKLVFYKIDHRKAVRNIMVHYKKAGEVLKITEAFSGFLDECASRTT